MMDDTLTQNREVALDPFEFFPGVASRIAGLGGSAPGPDHNYVFHTGYFEAAPGPSRFIIQFHNLTAKTGTLWLRVHMLPMEAGSRAVMANSDRIQFNRLIRDGSRVEIKFEGFRGMSFALYAGVEGETDAGATGVEIWFDRPASVADAPVAATDGRTTNFGRHAFRPTTYMLSLGTPTFATPSTQLATRKQLAEPTFRARLGDLNQSVADVGTWQQAYVLQVLNRYGLVQAGAKGLDLGGKANSVSAALASTDVSVTAANRAYDSGDNADEAPAVGATTPQAFDLAPNPAELIDFDFTYSIGAWDILQSPGEALRFLEDSLATLRPGGLAVHTGLYRLSDADDTSANILSRADIERLLLILISRGHEVAQFKVADRDALIGPDGISGCIGLIFKRRPSVL